VAKISIVTTGHISSNPRVWREADALSAAGHDVVVTGVWFDPVEAELDQQMLNSRSWQFIPAADLRGPSFYSKAYRLWSRLRAKCGRVLLKHSVRNANALGYAVSSLYRCAFRQRAELTITHLEPALWVGLELKRMGFAIGVDFEDWYSEGSTETPLNTPSLQFYKDLERKILTSAVHVTTTTRSMANALQEAYSPGDITVIYNSTPVIAEGPSSPSDDTLRLLWFSQTLGKDRGLQDIFAALPLLKEHWGLELRAKASPSMRAWAESQVAPALRSRVRIEPTVPPEELSNVVACHDVGLALEQPSCLNKQLTASNKIFQYLQSGLLVAATDTTGQREVLSEIPLAGLCYAPGDFQALAEILNGWISELPKIRERKAWIYREANLRFSYQHQSERLLDSVNRALRAS
jgi:glycosyltransferase involved in cell wall biosynthesis